MKIHYPHVYALLFLMFFSHASSRTILTNSSAKFFKAVAAVLPGDTIVAADGVYESDRLIIISKRATDALPILIKAKKTGKAKFAGETRFSFQKASHIMLEGFVFNSTCGPAVELLGSDNIRISRNVFRLKETTRSNWVMITGFPDDTLTISHQNRIDHNSFESKRELGNFITIEGTKKFEPQSSQFDRIDHNLFKDIGPRVENALEAIRSGSAPYSVSSGFTVIEKNLFIRCDGDPEYISIKASDDTIRWNTFRECLGVLSLRHGNRSVVDGNFILGNGRTGIFIDSTGKKWTLGTGGIRFYGDGMKIINNYFEGLTGSNWDATLAITSGNAEYGDGQPLTKHFRIRDAVIAFNTMIDCRSNFEIGYDGAGFQGNWWRLPPDGLTIANNVVVSASDTLVKIFSPPANFRLFGNFLFPKGKAVLSNVPVEGVKQIDPQLRRQGELWRIQNSSPLRHAAEGDIPEASKDMDGQVRKGKKDAGSDHFSIDEIVNKPLTEKEVGPFAP